MSLFVREPGVQSLLVDLGRERSRALGVPVGGAADRTALALGNALVGNTPDAVGLEITLVGPTLEALQPTACAVFGAPFQIAIDGRAVPAGATFQLEPGEVLRVGGTPAGARAYLCVAGGFEASEVLGSRSELEPVREGDLLVCPVSHAEGRALPFACEEPLPPTPSPKKGGGVRHIDSSASPDAPDASAESPSLLRGGVGEGFFSLRALDGPQRDWFTDDRFFTQTYTVLPASNRMGLRLTGEPLARRPGELVSEAVAPGAVQITNDGLPIVLGIDGQTIGGYPKVAHVVRADLDRLARLRPGDRVRFVRVTPAEAEAAARERTAFLRDWLTRLRVAERRPVVG